MKHRRRASPAFALLAVACAGLTACTQPRASAGAGSSFRDCPDCPEMVVVPVGSFMMGSPDSEPGRFPEEGPQHVVTIARPFAVGRTPVTRAEYERFVQATGRHEPDDCARMSHEGNWVSTAGLTWRNPGFEQTDEDPVVCVSWEDALAYAAWLAAKSGKAYRLLSEAEYEYMARAGSTTAFAWGDSDRDLCAHANGFDASARRVYPDWPGADCDDGYAYTAPVGSFPANAFGITGATGNVFQWTADCFADSYAGAPAEGSARTEPGCELRVIRGGSWLNSGKGLRSAMRDIDRQRDRYENIGIRVARGL